MNDKNVEVVWKALDRLAIELPSWDLPTPGRALEVHSTCGATSIQEKFSDAHRCTRSPARAHSGTACSMDLPNGLKDVPEVERLAKQFSIRPGSINPNIFQNQEYKYARSGIQILHSAHGDSAHCRLCGDLGGFGRTGHLTMVRGWLELPGYAEYSQAHRLF